MKNKLSIVILAIGMAITGLANSETINISANLPLSGPLATYGVAVQRGVNMALDEASAIGDGTHPRIVIDWQDNASEPKTAVSILKKQLLSPPDIYVSGVKPQTMAIKDELSKLNIPHFVWIFDARINFDPRTEEESDNNFRTWVSYKIEPPVYIDYIRRRDARRIAITYVNLPHTVDEFQRILVPELKEQGYTDIFLEPYDFGRTDFKDIAVKIVDFKPDLIILNGFQNDLVGLIRSLRPLDAITDGNTIATYDLLDAAAILGADEIEGIRIVAPLFETRPEATEIAEWKSRFEERYGRTPLYTDAFAYDMIGAIRAAAGILKLPASRCRWIKALHEVDVQGITGPVRFDSDGDMLTPLEVGVYRGGRLVPDLQFKQGS